MVARDVVATLEQAVARSTLERTEVVHRPRLLSDNGPPYVSGALADWLKARSMAHAWGKPYHPMNQARSSVGTD